MKRLFLTVVLTMVAMPALAADVGVSISIDQPGFYGRIDLGDVRQPPVVYAKPIIVQPLPPGVVYEPIYLHVPPGQEKHWHRYCGRYNACGRPVYFVKDGWYNDVYAPRHRGGANAHGHGRGHKRH